MQQSLALADLPPADRLDVWRAALNAAFVPMLIEPELDDLPTFAVHGTDVGNLRVTNMRASAGTAIRTKRLVSDNTEPYVVIGLQSSGTCLVTQDGREQVMQPGTILYGVTPRTYSLTYNAPFSQSFFRIPRSLIDSRDALLDPMTATAIPTDAGIGRLLLPLLTGIAADAAVLAGPGGNQVGSAVIELLSAAVYEQAARELNSPESAHAMLRMRLQRFIDDRIGDSELNPRHVAAAHGISVRQIHKIFAGSGGTTFGATLRELRLQAAARELRNPAMANRTVAAIGRGCGFPDAAHFSRVFTQRFGVGPRQWRESARGT